MVNPGCVLQIADFSAAFSSNFLSSLFRLQDVVRERLGLDTVYVFPDRASGRPWIRTAQDRGALVRFLDRGHSHGERVRALRRLGQEHHAALFHTHFGTFDVDAAYAASRVGSPVIWHMHSPYLAEGGLRRMIGERLKFTLVTRILVDRIVAVSPSVAESAVGGGAPRARIAVVLNGIDLERAHPLDPTARRTLRGRLGVADEETVFLLLGWDPARKGVDLFAEAARQLPAESGGRSRCLIVSGETNEDEVSALVRNVPSVRVIRSVPDVAELYGLADCFVSASRAEGLPYAIGEAMAAGLPVITSDLPQIAAVYGPAGPGVLTFRGGDPRALATAMGRILALPRGQREALGKRNAAFVQEHLSLQNWTERMIGVYRSVLETNGGRGSSSRA